MPPTSSITSIRYPVVCMLIIQYNKGFNVHIQSKLLQHTFVDIQDKYMLRKTGPYIQPRCRKLAVTSSVEPISLKCYMKIVSPWPVF